MGNCISSSSVTPQVAAPIANHDTAPPIQFPPEIWRAIAAVATADSVVTLRQVSDDMRQAIDGLQQADLTQINQHADSTVELYQSDDGLRSVTKDPQAQRALARDANIPPTLQTFFARSNDPGVRWALAGNPSLTDDARQERLAQDDDARVRAVLAGNPSLTDAAQQTLAQDDNADVRWALAYNPSLTSDAAQQTLAQDDDPFVRLALAGNPSLTDDAQQTLVQDDDPDVRMALAENPSLTDDARQERLAQDDAPLVRLALAGNPSLTPRARKILEQHRG